MMAEGLARNKVINKKYFHGNDDDPGHYYHLNDAHDRNVDIKMALSCFI